MYATQLLRTYVVILSGTELDLMGCYECWFYSKIVGKPHFTI